MRQLSTLILCAVLAVITGAAQSVLWNVDFETRFENREGGDELTPDQTIFYLRLNPEVGITLPADERHTLMGGVAWYQPVNDHGDGYKVLPTVYYRYRDEHRQFALGYVPRYLAIAQLPRYLMSDSLRYCSPVIKGMMFTSTGTHGEVQAILDWRQMQSERRREAFVVTGSGFYNLSRNFDVGGHLQYNHLAKRKNAPEDEGVNDDVTVNPMLRWRPLSALTLQAGAIVQLQRARVDHKWHTPCAFIASGTYAHRRFVVSEELTAGKNLYPLYPRFGSELNLGDPYYCYKFHSRTDADAIIFNGYGVRLTAGVTLHATDNTFGWWQTVKATFTLGGKFNK